MNDDIEYQLRRAMAEHDEDINVNPWSDVAAARQRPDLEDRVDRLGALRSTGPATAMSVAPRRGSERSRLRLPLAAAAAVLVVVGGAVTIIGSQTARDRSVAPPSSSSASSPPVSGSSNSSEPAPPATTALGSVYKTAVLAVSWPTVYTSISALTKDADLVVAGTFGRVATADAIVDGDEVPIGADVTTRDFLVRQALKFTGRATTTIQITQTGSISKAAGVITQVPEDPLFAEGESAVLFLKAGSPGKYHVIGGPTGRFKLNGELVSAYSSPGAPVKEMPLTAFAARVSAAVSTSAAPTSMSPSWLRAVATSQAARYGETSPGTPTWKAMTAASVMKAFEFTDSTESDLSVTVIQMQGNFTAPRSPQGVERPHGTWLIVAAFDDGRVWTVQMQNTPII